MIQAWLEGGKIQISQNNYESHKMPGNHEESEKHRNAWKVASPVPYSEDPQELCPCCLRSIKREEIKFDAEDMALSFLGSGYPLYFNFIKCCLMIVGVMFLTSGQYNLVSNLISKDCDDLVVQVKHQHKINVTNEWNDPVINYCLNDPIAVSTMANKRFSETLNSMPKYFNLTSVIFILIIILFFRKSQMNLDNECDIKENTPSDYTILIKGLPQMNDPYIEIKEYFEQQWNVDIAAINIVYLADQLNDLELQKQSIVEEKRAILQKTEQQDFDRISLEFDAKIKSLHQQVIEKAKQIWKEPDQFTGQAFVSFKFEEQKQTILKQCDHRISQVLFNMIFGCIFYEQKELNFKGNNIKIEQAPEPLDVIWENVVHNENRRMWVRIMGFIFSQLMITIFFSILLYLAKIQAEQSNIKGELVEVDTGKEIVSVVLPVPGQQKQTGAVVAALLTTFINSFVVDKLSVFLVNFESYETYSLYTVSLASKLSLMLFFNSAIITYIACSVYTRNIYGPGGLIYTQMYFFLTNAIIPPLLNIIDTNYIMKLASIWYIKKFKKVISQGELNKLYEYPEHPIELKYADIMKTLFITFFYAPLIPAAYILGFIGLTLTFYSEKYVLIKRKTVKHTPSIQLSILMTEMIEYLPIIFAVGSCMFRYQIANLYSFLDIISVLLALVCSILPIQYFVELLFPVDQQDETTSFDQASVNFQTMYDKENPVTKYVTELLQQQKEKDNKNNQQSFKSENDLSAARKHVKKESFL